MGEEEKLDYSGGGTNHAAAITACQETLAQSLHDDRENVILLITDGVATMPDYPFESAEAAADLAKEAGTMIVPVFVSPENQQQLDYMAGLSSDGQVADVTDFAELSSLI